MTIHELFEKHYADHNDTTPEVIRSCRMINGSYNNLPIARAFRMFRSGFEANNGDKFHLLGYLSKKATLSASQGKAVLFCAKRNGNATEAIYVKQCEAPKTGE